MAVLAAGCTGDKDRSSHEPQIGDTAYTADAAMAVFDSDPRRALTIIDSAEIVGNIDDKMAQFLKAKVYSQSTSEQNIDTARILLEYLIKSDFAEEVHQRELVLDLLVYVARLQSDNVSYLRWATEKVDFCRRQGSETEALRTEAEVGAVLSQMGEDEKGLAKLNGVIASLDGQRHFNEMDACIIAIKRKINVLILLDRPAEIIPLGYRIINKINDYRQHPADYADGSYRLPPTTDKIQGYCDFYTAQAQAFLARAYAEVNEKDSAHYYLSLFQRHNYASTLGGKVMMVPTYRILREYPKMLELYNIIEKGIGNDTINYEYATLLMGRAQAAEAAGNYHAANGYWKRHIALTKLLNKELLDSRSYEYAARYHLQEEQMNTERERARTKIAINWAIFGFILVLLSILFIFRLLRQSRAISRKNRVLVEQISETTKLKSMVASTPHTPDNNTPAAQGSKPSRQNPDEMSDNELFAYISDVIRSEKMFLNPLFERQMIIDRLNINKNRIGAAFAQGSKYNSLSDFVRDLRLEYACQLLTEHPDMSIGEVAAASGFSSATVFGRDFKNKFEVSPTLFRNQNSDNKQFLAD